LARELEPKGIEGDLVMVRRILRIRMKGVEVPAPVAVSFFLESPEGGPHPRIVRVPEGREDIEAHEQVVVIVDGIVQPHPWSIRSTPFPEQPAVEIEFGASFNGPIDGGGPKAGGQSRESGEGFPTIERADPRRETVPTSVLFLVSHEPVDRPREDRFIGVAEPGEHSDSVAREADLARSTPQISRGPAESAEEQSPSFGDRGMFSGNAEIGQDEKPPVRRDIFRTV
jgi:hypothetical protein